MASVDRGLATREAQLVEAVDILVKKHGAQSETVALVQARLDEIQAKIKGISLKVNKLESQYFQIPKQEDAKYLFIIIGGILIFAVGGLSSMFMVMLAVKW